LRRRGPRAERRDEQRRRGDPMSNSDRAPHGAEVTTLVPRGRLPVKCAMIKLTRWTSLLLLAGFLGAAVPRSAALAAGKIGGDCSLKGHKLFGKIQVVKAFPDLKVQIVTAFPDLKVQKVDAFPDKCGQWKMVDAFPDLKIQFVDAFPDLKIQYVNAFPGVP
jgi:hypothetical protein